MCIVVAALLIWATLDIIHSGQRDPTLTEDVTLRIGLLESVDSLNPFIGLNIASNIFYGLVYDYLFSVNNELEPTPNLALEAYMLPESDPSMVSSGEPYGSVWQYNLTHNAYWHDGTPFTADDVVWNIWLSADVTHYNTMWAYQPYSYFIKSAEKVDNYTVRIHFWDRQSGMSVPISWGRSIPIPMLPRHLMEDFTYPYVGMDWKGVFNNTLSPGLPIVGTGPFMATPDIYSEWLHEGHITLVKNPDYHLVIDKGVNYTMKFDRLILRFYQESTSAVLALKNNDIDVASLPPAAFESIRNGISSGEIHERSMNATSGPNPVGTSTQLTFNMRHEGPNPARLDVTIRRAIHMAIDKSHIVDDTFLGNAEEGTTMISSGNTWHFEPSESEKFPYDLVAANASLDANGYVDTDSDGIRECTLSSPAVVDGFVEEGSELRFSICYFIRDYGHQAMAQYLASQTQKIGIEMNTTAIDERFMSYSWWLYDRMDAALVTSWGDIDPNLVLFMNTKKAWNGWSLNNYFNPAYDENYNLSVKELDPEVRQDYVDNCQRISYNDSASIVLVYQNATCIHRNDTFFGWGNWEIHPGRSLNAIWGANPLFFDLTPSLYTGDVDVRYGLTVFVVAGAIIAVLAVVVGMMILVRGRTPGSKSQKP